MPIVTFFLAVEAMATPGFANCGGLPETDEESIIVPTFQGIHGVINVGASTSGAASAWAVSS